MTSHQDVATKFGTGRKTLKSYLIGLGLSLLFTLLAFWLVAEHALSNQALYVLLAVFAVCQLVAQVVFFLRITASKEGRWNLMPFLFTIIIVLVLVFGSLWIMINLNYNMVN